MHYTRKKKRITLNCTNHKILDMKQIVTLLFFYYSFSTYCQDTTYNHFSVDAESWINNPIYPMTAGYDASTLNLYHVGLGFRYMVNTKFGLRLSTAYDHFRERPGTPYFSSEYSRVSLEGVANLGNIMDFKGWTNRLGLLFHLGVGYSVLNGRLIDPNHIFHGIIGFTPQIKLSQRFSINVDAAILANIYQNYTYDLHSSRKSHGIDAYLVNLSVGLQYNFGRKQHADWVVIPDKNAELQNLRNRIEKLEDQQRDDDGDGVVNWLDEEAGTPAGTIVDTKGRTAAPRDTDSDNIPDDVDDCPFEKGTPERKGCPERAAGSLAGNNNSQEVIDIIESSEVKFETDKTGLSPSFKQLLTAIAKVLKDNPSYKLHITGHSDDRASEEYNKTLSKNRADAAKAYLVEQGIATERITTEGMGESQPLNPQKTVEARAENRRITFDIR